MHKPQSPKYYFFKKPCASGSLSITVLQWYTTSIWSSAGVWYQTYLQLYKALSKLAWPRHWPCFEQCVGRETLWVSFPLKRFSDPVIQTWLTQLPDRPFLSQFQLPCDWRVSRSKHNERWKSVLCHCKAWKPSTKIHTQHDNGRTINTYRATVKFRPVTGSNCWTCAITRTYKEKRNEIEKHG